MKCNMGFLDRAARIILGLVLIGLSISSTIGAWGYLGAIPLIMGLIGNCPLYTLLKINTCKAKN
ncbi:YgaP family membrane protein [Thiopseudomonas alkaliphila]|uniref:DUF2892 domain-containing protein n=1 Tax=Thiopseudomonas alkaliphila TaxID=1697053 RepID=A0A0K1XDF4_9GAMM|nr:DUF2892 domain-containing protein [Thiopseudomonas alkaliphila]AKX51261.1 hypothetical protein AKN92_06940 [Thiopseudomonas alkaliphila]AKX53460.1 hypothetical protein AKN91_07090 [Thiopseudomonas alkaliphila]AKX55575.1 hypothetical protein AKN90_07525 [Thiopseudomonas alkaliphila]AKX57616.1 hypothetical protein AKN89_07150 [Thiopseudomonas alkaliphila]AKX59430.1 hypothetical protein AKN88_05410 [Thiopseudomonas alkaliphila]